MAVGKTVGRVNRIHKTMKLLSYDCANKSLGYTLFTADVDEIARKYLPVGKPNPDKIHAMIRNDIAGLKGLVAVHACGVVNLFAEKVMETNIIYRTKKLRQALDESKFIEQEDIDKVVIEYQCVAGSPSREVSDMLLMYYSSRCINMFAPSARKKVHFAPDISYDVFAAKYNKPYDANKAHSIANTKYLAAELELEVFKECMEGIPVGNRDDLAESFMNAWVWMIKNVVCDLMQPLHVARTAAEKQAKLEAAAKTKQATAEAKRLRREAAAVKRAAKNTSKNKK